MTIQNSNYANRTKRLKYHKTSHRNYPTACCLIVFDNQSRVSLQILRG
jgi:hypothetical protein